MTKEKYSYGFKKDSNDESSNACYFSISAGKSRGIAVHKSQTNSVSQQMNLSKR